MATAQNKALQLSGCSFVESSNAFPQTHEKGLPLSLEKGCRDRSESGDATPTSLESAELVISHRSKARSFLIMSAVYLAVFIAVLDTVSLPTALPTITVALNASDSGFAWIGATHMISGAVSVPVWGKISDIFGRKWVISFAKVAFLAGSLVSATCTDIRPLFVGRVIQGMSGAGIVLLANLVIDDLFDQRDRAFYLSLIAVTWSFAVAVSPVIGGYFADTIGWRWCFWLNLPCVGLSLVVLLLLLENRHCSTPLWAGLKRIDWLGTISIASSVILFLIGIEFGGVRFPWHSPVIICLLVLSLILFILFLVIEWRVAEQPLFPPALFKSRSISAAYVVGATHGMAFQSHLYFMPCYFQAVLGASQGRSGLGSLIMTGMLAITNVSVGIFIKRHGGHLIIARIGSAILTLGVGLMIDLQPHRDRPRVISYQLIIGIGLGMLFQSSLIALQKQLRGAFVAAGTSAFLFLRPLSYGISACVGQLLLQSQMKTKYSEMLDAGISQKVAGTLAFEDTVKGTPLIKSLTKDQQFVVKAAIEKGLEKVWIFYTVVAFIALVASFCLAETKEPEQTRRDVGNSSTIRQSSRDGVSGQGSPDEK
ncbi:hypothetical protein ACLMJK_000793 [Lecanora helva]